MVVLILPKLFGQTQVIHLKITHLNVPRLFHRALDSSHRQPVRSQTLYGVVREMAAGQNDG